MNDQATNLRRKLIQSKHPDRITKTISIVSGKGGVGKSNFALNFALELLNKKKKVLLIDLDLGMGNIDILIGLSANKTMIDMLNDRLSIHEIIEKGPDDLAYIAGGSGITDLFTMNQSQVEYFFKQYQELMQIYDYIVFDLGAGITKDSLLFILASTECFVITTPEPTAIMDAYSIIKHIVNKQQNMPIYVVMNRCLTNKGGRESFTQFQHVILRFLHIQIPMIGILPEDKTVSKAVMKQTPYLMLDNKSQISKALQQITANYLLNLKEIKKQKSVSFIQRLKQLLRV